MEIKKCKIINLLYNNKLIDADESKKLKNEKLDIGTITFYRRGWGNTITTYVDRGEFLVVMQYLKKNYERNNEVSTKLVEIIPYLKEISIEEQRNLSMDVPKIWCKLNNGKTVGINVRRCHKIIWKILSAC